MEPQINMKCSGTKEENLYNKKSTSSLEFIFKIGNISLFNQVVAFI